MKVSIFYKGYSGNPGYHAAVLALPAGRHAIQDALERAHVPEGESHNIRAEYHSGLPGLLGGYFRQDDSYTLDEMNYFAWKLEQMRIEEGEMVVTALSCLYQSEHEIQPKEAINALYNLDCFQVYPGIESDKELGDLCLFGGFNPEIDGLDDEVHALLDSVKVGTMQREQEQGIYRDGSYVIMDLGAWRQAYDGETFPETAKIPDSIVSTLFRQGAKGKDPETERRLEERLGLLDQPGLKKYRAVLEFERCGNFKQALELADRLSEYDIETSYVTEDSKAASS